MPSEKRLVHIDVLIGDLLYYHAETKKWYLEEEKKNKLILLFCETVNINKKLTS